MEDTLKGSPNNFVIGNVGDGARIVQGLNNRWIESVARLDDGEFITQRFSTLLGSIKADVFLDEDDRAIALSKTTAVAEALAAASSSPDKLRLAVKDAQSWFSVSATWIWTSIRDILKSDEVQKTIGTITEAGTRAAITQVLS